ncbi:hypothetical protein CEXT_768701 [Caerostris extrusa]|uniref:Uncharacterized protein n=1 Tax=Caerostris extrusa TaxID=172846 RepID=A0AAV4PWW4_CAEEX|nr:hypothetical protein CEXT_768701 [Caerostris extrusa]
MLCAEPYQGNKHTERKKKSAIHPHLSSGQPPIKEEIRSKRDTKANRAGSHGRGQIKREEPPEGKKQCAPGIESGRRKAVSFLLSSCHKHDSISDAVIKRGDSFGQTDPRDNSNGNKGVWGWVIVRGG